MDRNQTTGHFAPINYCLANQGTPANLGTAVNLENAIKLEKREDLSQARERKQSIPLYLYERKLSKPGELEQARKPAPAAIMDRNVTRICISSSSSNQRLVRFLSINCNTHFFHFSFKLLIKDVYDHRST